MHPKKAHLLELGFGMVCMGEGSPCSLKDRCFLGAVGWGQSEAFSGNETGTRGTESGP